MATANFLTAAAKASTKATYLLEIDLIGTGTTYASSKTIYLSDRYLTIESVDYEGIVLDWGGLDVNLPSNEGIASINDFSILLANKRLQFFEADVRFSDIFDDYYFAGSVARVYQWFDELTLKSDAELIFTGICKQPAFDLNEIVFEIVEDDSVFIDIPISIVNLSDYSEAPQESIGKPIPIVYGKFDSDYGRQQPTPYLSPVVMTNKRTYEFYIADHEIKEAAFDTYEKLSYYHQGSGLWGSIQAANSVFTNEKGRASVELSDPAYLWFIVPLAVKGTQYTAATTDYSNLLDYNNSTTISLSGGEKLYLMPAALPEVGPIENMSSIAIVFYCYVDNVAGTSPYATMTYYNQNYNNGNPAHSTGTTITGNGQKSYNIHSDRTAKGIRGDQADEDDPWTWQDLGSLEYGLTMGAGDSLDISWMFLHVGYIPLIVKEKRKRIR